MLTWAIDAYRSAHYLLAQSLNLVWEPRVDGKFLKDTPQQLVLKGSVANIPFVTGESAILTAIDTFIRVVR